MCTNYNMRDAPLPRIKVTETAGGFRLLRRGRARRGATYFPTPPDLPPAAAVDASRANASAGLLHHALSSPHPCRSSYPPALALAAASSRSLCSSSSRSSSYGLVKIVHAVILISLSGRSAASVSTFSILASVSMPPTTRPKTVCLPSSAASTMRDEKLRPVRILPSVRHAQHASVVVSERIILNLILERLSPYAVPSFARAGGVAALKHKVLDASMKLDVVVVSLLRERDEIFASSRRSIAV